MEDNSGKVFMSFVNKTDTCWLWTGYIDANGYGRYGHSYAHRVAYEWLVDWIPEGYEVDHVVANGCTNKHCVNPAHLEAVTHNENVLRGNGTAAINARKTQCSNGHDFTPENTVSYGPSKKRKCRECQREYSRRYRAR